MIAAQKTDTSVVTQGGRGAPLSSEQFLGFGKAPILVIRLLIWDERQYQQLSADAEMGFRTSWAVQA